jgi:phospholipid/cholesterol/gamma-HCH transport system ATP-binding protein
MLHEFDEHTAEAIRKSLPEDLLAQVDSGAFSPTRGSRGRHWAPEPDARGAEPQVSGATVTAVLPRQGGAG